MLTTHITRPTPPRSLFWPLRAHAGGASCRSVRAWPEGLAALRSRRLRRRPWRAKPYHTALSNVASRASTNARPSIAFASPRPTSLRPRLSWLSLLARAGRETMKLRPANPGQAVVASLVALVAFLLLRRRASPSLVAGRYHHALARRTRRRVAQAGYQYHSLPSLPCSTQQPGRPNHPSPPHRPTPGRRLERKEELRFCAREASPCLARRRKGTSSAGPFPEGSLARKAATRDSGQARRCGGHTGFTCQPPLCLLLSHCLVPCLPHCCPFTSVLILDLALQLRS